MYDGILITVCFSGFDLLLGENEEDFADESDEEGEEGEESEEEESDEEDSISLSQIICEQLSSYGHTYIVCSAKFDLFLYFLLTQ